MERYAADPLVPARSRHAAPPPPSAAPTPAPGAPSTDDLNLGDDLSGFGAEGLARHLLATGCVNVDTVTRVLAIAADTVIPYSRQREKIMPEGCTRVRRMVCGLYVQGKHMGLTSATRKCPWLTKLLVEFLRQSKPDFVFTSIQVNINYATRPHVDRNNLGLSCIVGLGSYTGGGLWVADDQGTVPLQLRSNLDTARYREGGTYFGKVVNISDGWFCFDGSKLHQTKPFAGQRYTLVYFTCKRLAAIPLALRVSLMNASFPDPCLALRPVPDSQAFPTGRKCHKCPGNGRGGHKCPGLRCQ